MGKHNVDLSGNKFGFLTVLNSEAKPIFRRNTTDTFWACQCDCGNKIICTKAALKSGNTKSCGCLKWKDLTGLIFGKLIVLNRIDPPKHLKDQRQAFYCCKCECGSIINIMGRRLRTYGTTSCGCDKSNIEDLTGKRYNKLLIIKRCNTPKNKSKKGIYWLCKCDCGREVIFTSRSIKGAKGCGCDRILGSTLKEPEINAKLSSAKVIWRQSYSDGDISFVKFLELSQNECFYCKMKESNNFNIFTTKIGSAATSIAHGQFRYNGLDRISNSKKHTVDNVVVCCRNCNLMRLDRNIDEFKIRILEAVNIYILTGCRLSFLRSKEMTNQQYNIWLNNLNNHFCPDIKTLSNFYYYFD